MDQDHPSIKVLDFILDNSRLWNVQKLQSLYDQETIEEIQKIILPANSRRQYQIIWIPNNKGKFSVKTVYQTMINSQEFNQQVPHLALFNKMWNLKIYDRHKLLLWKIFWNILPTRSKVKSIIPHIKTTNCALCNQEEEDLEHLFVKCLVNRIEFFGVEAHGHYTQMFCLYAPFWIG